MPMDVRLWEVFDKDKLKEVLEAQLDLEERIENWLEDDISIISKDLLVIGRQVETDFGGFIDLLCLNSNGDVTIVELKRDKTPREVTAQVLDYASWVKNLSNNKLTDIANRYFGDNGTLEEAFNKRFGVELPEILNENHNMLIVGSDIDSSSERIIKYMSDTYGVGINAVTFQYFREETGKQLLARVFLIEPSEVEYKAQSKASSKRKPRLTYEELEEIAKDNDVGEIYVRLVEGLSQYFRTGRTRSSISLRGVLEDKKATIISLIPIESNSQEGLKYHIYIPRFSEHLGIDEKKAIDLLPENKKEWKYFPDAPPDLSGYEGFFFKIWKK